MSEKQRALEALARAQWRLALTLTAAMMAIYFGFTLLVAWAKRGYLPGLRWCLRHWPIPVGMALVGLVTRAMRRMTTRPTT